MKAFKFLGLPLLLFMYLIIAIPFQSCEPGDDDGNDNYDPFTHDSCSSARKPNIYLYPNKKILLTVKLGFPMGGKIITSIPEYRTGWSISVDTNGLIDNSYSYLFYESTQPDIWQKNDGWVVKNIELEAFFRSNMASYGFRGQEIQDFIDYWIPRLNSYPYYSICPQTAEIINKVINLTFSSQPDNVLRLFYVIKGFDKLPNKFAEPIITSFNREGFFVTEWGVVLH